MSLFPASISRGTAPRGWLQRLLTPRTLQMPSVCSICHAWPARLVCQTCVERFDVPVRRCRACALSLPASDPDATLCARCLTAPPAALAGCHAALPYAWPWNGCIDRFKFHAQPGLATALAERMAAHSGIADALRQADLLVPIPLSADRLAQRGYNQSLLLARALRRLWRHDLGGADDRAVLRPQALQRVRSTLPQSTLNPTDRRRNVRGAFAVPAGHTGADLQGRHALLLDDVMTTGHTLQEAARVLRRAGCASVQAVVLARADRP